MQKFVTFYSDHLSQDRPWYLNAMTLVRNQKSRSDVNPIFKKNPKSYVFFARFKYISN